MKNTVRENIRSTLTQFVAAHQIDRAVELVMRQLTCSEHCKKLECSSCTARARGKKGAKALHSKTSHETRVEWGKKGGRKAKDVVITKTKDDGIHLRMNNG